MITVTKPDMPSLLRVNYYLEKIWQNKIVTNNGPLNILLEEKLKEYLNVNNLLMFSNATSALMSFLYILNDNNKKVLTTPFTFVATASVLKFLNFDYKFIDISSDTLGINTKSISHYSLKNDIVFPVSVYGIVNKILDGSSVLYDNSHCFVKNYSSIYGLNNAVISTHATKIFNTVEGGIAICENDFIYKEMIKIRNFGFNKGIIESVGINSKLSELHAAFGLSLLEQIDSLILRRIYISSEYNDLFKNYPQIIVINSPNYSYYPIVFPEEGILVKFQKYMMANNIETRRYFYPSLNNNNIYRQNESFPISETFASKILCMPLYSSLNDSDLNKIKDCVINFFDNNII
jgi:dTDP-4-amino-4,6-dideoxygalactose transaminase